MFVIVEPTMLNFAVSAVVIRGMEAMIATVIAAAIKLYSIAVAPL